MRLPQSGLQQPDTLGALVLHDQHAQLRQHIGEQLIRRRKQVEILVDIVDYLVEHCDTNGGHFVRVFADLIDSCGLPVG